MLLARDRENERSLVVQAQESVSAAEAAVANEDYVLAASKFAVASDLFLMSANAVLDEQSALSLRLLAETHKQRSEEILAYLKAERLQMFERSQKKQNKNERRRRQRAISLQESPCQRRPIRAAAVTSSSDLYSVLSESTPSASASASSSLDWPGLSVNDVLSSSCTSSSSSIYSSCEMEEAEGPFREKTDREGALHPDNVADSFIIVKSETEEIVGEKEGVMEEFEEQDIQRGEEETTLVDAKDELLAEKEEPEETRIEQRTKPRSRSLSGHSNGTSSKQELASSSDQHRYAFVSQSMFVQPMVERSSTVLNQKEGLFKSMNETEQLKLENAQLKAKLAQLHKDVEKAFRPQRRNAYSNKKKQSFSCSSRPLLSDTNNSLTQRRRARSIQEQEQKQTNTLPKEQRQKGLLFFLLFLSGFLSLSCLLCYTFFLF